MLRRTGSFCAILLLGMVAGCGSKLPQMPEGRVIEEDAGPVQLAYRRMVGEKKRYEWFFAYESDGPSDNHRALKFRARVTEHVLGSFKGDNGIRWEMLAWDRIEFEHRHEEKIYRKLRSGEVEKVTRVDERPAPMSAVGYISKSDGATPPQQRPAPGLSRFYAVKADGHFAVRKDKNIDYHLVMLDSPAFLFPLLPEMGEAAVGESWQQTIRLRAGQQPPTIECTQTATVRELREVDGKRCAVLDYEWSGEYDALQATSPLTQLKKRVLKGEGTVLWDIQRGRWLWREDRFSVENWGERTTFDRDTGSDHVKTETLVKEQHQIETGHVVARLLNYGEKIEPNK